MSYGVVLTRIECGNLQQDDANMGLCGMTCLEGAVHTYTKQTWISGMAVFLSYDGEHLKVIITSRALSCIDGARKFVELGRRGDLGAMF